jgi:hypothetical protein
MGVPMQRLLNHAKLWTEQDDADLWNMRMAGVPLKECAKRMARSGYAIEIRWIKLRKRYASDLLAKSTLPPLESEADER